MDDRARAARNNAAWCATVWRSHSLATVRGPGFVAATSRTPDLYPDAVTVEPGVAPAAILARVDGSAGCSIKDSFADLELGGLGFEVLFEAQWYLREPGRPGHAGDAWADVTTRDGLATWAAAHGGGAVFRDALLREPGVRVLVRRLAHGGIAGAILNDAAGVVGVSNLFAEGDADPARAWAGLADAVHGRFPGRTVVGYDAGDDLRAAERAGVRVVGPLRVWLRPRP